MTFYNIDNIVTANDIADSLYTNILTRAQALHTSIASLSQLSHPMGMLV